MTLYWRPWKSFLGLFNLLAVKFAEYPVMLQPNRPCVLVGMPSHWRWESDSKAICIEIKGNRGISSPHSSMAPMFRSMEVPQTTLPQAGRQPGRTSSNNVLTTSEQHLLSCFTFEGWGKVRIEWEMDRLREKDKGSGRSLVKRSHQCGAHWSNRGLVWFQILGTRWVSLFSLGGDPSCGPR